MDILKENTLLYSALIFAAVFCLLLFPNKTASAEAAPQKVGTTDAGTVFLLPDTVQILRKGDTHYLLAAAEEQFTDDAFLSDLHSTAGMETAASEWKLYMFTSDGRYYCTPQRYLLDTQGNTCVDLGSNMQLAMIDNKLTADIYTAALHVLEGKNP